MTVRKKYIIIGGSAVLLLVGIIVVLLFKNAALERQAEQTRVQSSEQRRAARQQPALSVENAQFLETALNSPDKTERAKAVVPELRANSWLANADLPKGSSVTIDRDSFSVDKDGKGSMDGSINGFIPVNFRLYLRQIDGQWLIESAEQT